MKCHICKEDNSFWEMVLISFPKYNGSSAKVKHPVCKECIEILRKQP